MSTCTFAGLTIEYDEQLLAPRQWTRAQSAWAAELLDALPAGDVLELYSGAGQIGLLAVAGRGRRLVCVDRNPAAATYIERNARTAAVPIEVRVGSVQRVLQPDEQFPLIIADPPWVPSRATVEFPQDPPPAIDGGPDGLQGIRTCLQLLARHLTSDGVAIMQVGPGLIQAQTTSELVAFLGLVVTERRYFPRGTLLRIERLSGPRPSRNRRNAGTSP